MRRFLGSRGAMSSLVIIVVLAIAAGGILIFRGSKSMTAYCADMPDSIGLYTGNAVTQMGYQVGTVKKITPQGKTVRVDFDIDSSRKLPQSVGAVTVSDSLVANRRLDLVGNYSGGPILSAGSCITNSKTPISVTKSLESVSTLANQLTAAGGKSEMAAALNSFTTLNKATQGISPQANAMIKQLGAVLRDPAAGMSDIGAIIDAFTPLTDGLNANWGELKSFLTDVPYNIQSKVIPLFSLMTGLFNALPPTANLAFSLISKYSQFIYPALDSVIPLSHILAGGMKNFGDLLGILPPLINAININFDQNTLSAHVTYRPPSASIPAKNPTLTCANINRLAPGQCTVVDSGHMNVQLIRWVLLATGAATP